ncbi:Xyloglucan endotransglucosylase/hydrolase protein 9 precursor [Hibiscus syriacus]|uniref:Xyloglucan endotransglucosylase/hydrolase protein 9 n=1 Tax=Hibiscus syriacus TaxID=106335 RepID=A0A6A3A5G2_HIBSY|nr:Xyloglucan endotransglucosylase/hydrolase protein 9 precursor [Hibiscus syriacus]
MGWGKVVLVCLVLVELLLLHATADQESEVKLKPSEVDKKDEAGWVISREANREPAESPADESGEAEAPEIRRLGKHHASDMSAAGGGVIIGGIFFTAIFASVFAYIRVTRKRVS